MSLSNTTQRLSAAESEVMQGWPPGIVSSHCSNYTSALQKVGNALNAHQMHSILREFVPCEATSLSFPMSADFYTSAQLEQELRRYEDEGRPVAILSLNETHQLDDLERLLQPSSDAKYVTNVCVANVCVCA